MGRNERPASPQSGDPFLAPTLLRRVQPPVDEWGARVSDAAPPSWLLYQRSFVRRCSCSYTALRVLTFAFSTSEQWVCMAGGWWATGARSGIIDFTNALSRNVAVSGSHHLHPELLSGFRIGSTATAS